MKYRALGKTGMKVSVVGLGTWQFGGEWGKTFRPEEVSEIINAARESGINLIDTAECYGDHVSEELIGQTIEHEREKWIVATKFGHRFNGFLDRTPDYSAKSMVRQLDASLKALRTDYIDLYQVHGVSEETFKDNKLWRTLRKQKKKGKIRAIGVSIGHDPFPLGRDIIDVVQVHHNRLDRGAEKEVLPLCAERNLGVLARVPLASGLLSGKYKPGQRWSGKDVRTRIAEQDVEKFLAEVERIREQEVPDGADLATWALSWCLRHPAVTSVIPGCKSPEQVRANAAAADLSSQ